ncbi:MAG TPA: hypothetical protein PLZ36_07215 [Armatimonadota bacterium]|nr:hypothetical protein [Armatimonadota bacterium]HOS43214.1 hypothetical protein [Armatimonadota bacterium]
MPNCERCGAEIADEVRACARCAEARITGLDTAFTAARRPSRAVLSLVLGLCALLVGVLVLLPVYTRAKETPRVNTCLNHQRQLALAFSIYMADNNETYPPANSDWAVILLPYAGGKAALFQCPSAGGQGDRGVPDYGANPGVLGTSAFDITYPDRTILTGDSTSADCLLHGTADLDLRRHRHGGVVARVDGSVLFLTSPPAALGP